MNTGYSGMFLTHGVLWKFKISNYKLATVAVAVTDWLAYNLSSCFFCSMCVCTV